MHAGDVRCGTWPDVEYYTSCYFNDNEACIYRFLAVIPFPPTFLYLVCVCYYYYRYITIVQCIQVHDSVVLHFHKKLSNQAIMIVTYKKDNNLEFLNMIVLHAEY